MNEGEEGGALLSCGRKGFSSIALAEMFGMVAVSPFLDEGVKLFARSIPPTLKIRSIGGEQVGKWIVGVAYERDLPEEPSVSIRI